MAVSTATASELTAEQVQRILVQPLEAASALLASGPRIFDSAGPVRIPCPAAAATLALRRSVERPARSRKVNRSP